MIYKYDLKTNKKAYLPFLVIGAMVLAALSTILFMSPVFATIISVIALFAASRMIKSMKRILSSRIETYTDGFNVFLSDGTKLEFEYNLITHAGLILNTGFVFAYEASIDRIVQLPPVFTCFDEFVKELKENTDCYTDYDLEEGKTIIDWLKKELGIPEKTEEESENIDALEDESLKEEIEEKDESPNIELDEEETVETN